MNDVDKKKKKKKKDNNDGVDAKELSLKLMEKENKIKSLDEEILKKEKMLTKRKKKDNINDKVVQKSNSRNKKKRKRSYEKMSCYIVFFIVLFLLYAVIRNKIFIPAFFITVGLFLFCIAYYYINDSKKKSLVYGLFEFGVFLVIVSIVYTIVLLV